MNPRVASTAGSMTERQLENAMEEFDVRSENKIAAMYSHYVLGKSKRSSALEAGVRPDSFFILCKRFNDHIELME